MDGPLSASEWLKQYRIYQGRVYQAANVHRSIKYNQAARPDTLPPAAARDKSEIDVAAHPAAFHYFSPRGLQCTLFLGRAIPTQAFHRTQFTDGRRLQSGL
jgi:hypothetical protein